MPRPKDKDAENSTTREAVIHRESIWLSKAMERSQKEGKEYYPVLTQSSFDKLKRNRDSLHPEFWSDEDEAQVMDQWDLDCAAKPCRRPNGKEQYIWKTSARFLRCLPTELIGMRYGLEYDTKEATSQNWTEPFCDRLVKIIAHPLFANEPAKIALAIKFSVCSWQRLKWVIPSHNDVFLQTVKNVAEERGELVGAQLVRDSIQEWRDTWPGEPELPPWAQLLKAIVAHGKQPVSAAELPHRVATKHLSAIVDSLDKITHGKLIAYHSVDVYERALKDIRANVDLPTNKDPVDQLLAEGFIHNRRLKVLHERYPEVADIYNHVSQPEARRPVPKEDYDDIYDGSSEDNESSDDEESSKAGGQSKARQSKAGGQSEAAQPDQPDQPAQADPPAKRKRGRPRKTENEVERGLGDQSDHDGEEPPAKRRPGRPRKNVTPVAPAPVAPAPEETRANSRPNAADADIVENTGLDDSEPQVVPVPSSRSEQNRTRIPSVPESIANTGEQRVVLPSRGATPDNGDAEDGAFFLDDDHDVEHEIASSLFSLPQRSLGSNLFDARPGTSQSEELGEDAPVGEVGTDERGTNEATPKEPSTAGTIPGHRSVGEPIYPSAEIPSSGSGGGDIEIPFIAHAGFYPEPPPGREASDSPVPYRPFAFYTSYGIPEAPPEEEDEDWFVPAGSSLPTLGKESNKPSAPVSANKKKKASRPLPLRSPSLDEQRRRIEEQKKALANQE